MWLVLLRCIFLIVYILLLISNKHTKLSKQYIQIWDWCFRRSSVKNQNVKSMAMLTIMSRWMTTKMMIRALI